MAIKYKNQEFIKAINSSINGGRSNRISEIRQICFGGRGGHNDELEYLRNRCEEAEVPVSGKDKKLSDIYITFSSSWAGITTKRSDQAKRELFESGSII